MNKKFKSYILCGILFVSILGTLAHFLYNWSGQNLVIGLFTPVNESTWEHIKLIFFPMLIYTQVLIKIFEKNYPCIKSASYIGILVGFILIPIIFYTYTGILEFHLLCLDIATFLVSVFLSFGVIYWLSKSCHFSSLEKTARFLILLLTFLFFIFTFFPPAIQLFAQP